MRQDPKYSTDDHCFFHKTPDHSWLDLKSANLNLDGISSSKEVTENCPVIKTHVQGERSHKIKPKDHLFTGEKKEYCERKVEKILIYQQNYYLFLFQKNIPDWYVAPKHE